MGNRLAKVALLGIGLATGASGCFSQNPYPTDGSISLTPPAPHHEVSPVYTLDVPATVSFTEGSQGTFKVSTVVQKGTPVIAIQNLPDGAVFDSVLNQLTWTPGPSAGHDPSRPDLFYKDYYVEFDLSSSLDPLTVVSRTIDIRVNGQPHPMTIASKNPTLDVQEGQTLSAPFQVVSSDFPAGPFDLSVTPLPDGMTLTPDTSDPSLYNVSYVPPYGTVTSDDDYDDSGYMKTIHLTMTATGPRAQKVVQGFDVVVHDVRRAPAVSAPNNLTFSYAAEFSLHAEDLNNEESPTVQVDPVPFGTINVSLTRSKKKSRDAANPVTDAVVDWTDIPAKAIGTSQAVTFHSCAQPGFDGTLYCTTTVVNMTFKGQLHMPPTFDRTAWPLGTVMFVREGSPISATIPVTDPDTGDALSVVVSPDAMQSQVSYAHGAVTVTPTVEGTQTFELTSTSAYGVASHESFTFRSLPATWGQTLILGTAKTDAEIQATVGIVGDSQFANPSMQTLDTDLLVDRKAVLIGTDAVNSGISAGDLGQALQLSIESLGHVIISTPLLAKVPAPALPSDLILAGRYASLTAASKPPLSQMAVTPVAGSPFVASQKPVKLSQTLTAESNNPMTFAVNPGGQCTVVMNLSAGTLSIPVAAVCVQGTTSALYVGFEWGDLYFDPADAGLARTWYTAWLGSTRSNHQKKAVKP